MRALLVAGGVCVALIAGHGVARADLMLSIADGKVTLVADNVSVRQILAEWGRLGQTRVVGAERLPATPLSLRLADVPEARALETLLRNTSGYVVAPRPVTQVGASQFDRILIMPPSTITAAMTPPPGARSPVAAQAPPSMPVQPPPMPDGSMADEAEEAEDDSGNQYTDRPAETNFDYANPQEMFQRRQELQQMGGPQGPPAVFPGSVVIPTQEGQPAQQPAPSVPTAVPGAPTSTSRPGEIAQPPQPTYTNPYGIAYPQPPQGALPAPGQQPDRSKYFNPYQPQPPKPPGGDR
jgi:hypothetical protein